jgi:NAD(P)-dependent dehydrogenase (short-subunit alcohol dehydrogenase family)
MSESSGERTRVALVTGANRGIGLEVARQLAKRGYAVILGSRDSQKGERAAARLAEEGLSVLPRQLDVSDNESVEDLAARIVDDPGHLDVLVNNAAIHYDTWQSAPWARIWTSCAKHWRPTPLGRGAPARRSSR